jgi:hypothetical protein
MHLFRCTYRVGRIRVFADSDPASERARGFSTLYGGVAPYVHAGRNTAEQICESR